jgi:hypothetical protein
MDLRGKLTPQQIKEAEGFVIRRLLWYQPFIFSDDFEVGEGMNFHDEYQGETGSVSSDVTNLAHFRKCNRELRRIYEHIVDSFVEQLGDISGLSFAEFGCNSGYFMYALSLRGARKTIGFDFAPNTELFEFFNSILGTNSEFRWAEWDSLHHTIRHSDLEEVDATMSLAVTTHIPDPIYHLAYLCDRARRAVLFWVSVSDKADLSVTFSNPDYHRDPDLDFPLNINSGVTLSRPLVRLILRESGFGEIHEIEPLKIDSQWDKFCKYTAGFIGLRTEDRKTALTGGRFARPVHSFPTPELLETCGQYSLVRYQGTFWATSLDLDRFDLRQESSRTPLRVSHQRYIGFSSRTWSWHPAIGHTSQAKRQREWTESKMTQDISQRTRASRGW